MAQVFLVELDLKTVRELVQAIDDRGLDVPVILFAKLDEYSEGKLILASPSFEQHTSSFNYLQFGDLLRAFGEPAETPYLLLMKMKDPFVIALREVFGPVERENGLRITNQPLGRRFIEEGYIFRIR